MKRVKRDLGKRAYKQGYNSGLKGLNKDQCPYSGATKKNQWVVGWQVGHADRVAGFRQYFDDLH